MTRAAYVRVREAALLAPSRVAKFPTAAIPEQSPNMLVRHRAALRCLAIA